MLENVKYDSGNEIESLKNFLTRVSNGVRHIFLETDFKELFYKSEYSEWQLFEKAFQDSYEQFQSIVKYIDQYPYYEPFEYFYWRRSDAFTQTGFKGASLEVKIAFWNTLAPRYNDVLSGAKENRLEIWKTIIKAVLDFCNIILESAKLLTGNDSLKEMKDLGKWIIKNSLGL